MYGVCYAWYQILRGNRSVPFFFSFLTNCPQTKHNTTRTQCSTGSERDGKKTLEETQ